MDLKEKNGSQFDEMSMDDINFNVPRQGQRVSARVIAVEDDLIYLDLNAQTEGRIYLNEF